MKTNTYQVTGTVQMQIAGQWYEQTVNELAAVVAHGDERAVAVAQVLARIARPILDRDPLAIVRWYSAPRAILQ
jgi:hypothetical protein